jgi:hypothetical protein
VNPKDIKIRAFKQPWDNGIRLYILDYSIFPKSKGICTNLTFETIEEGAAYPDSAAIPLDNTSTQSLMDMLWDCGFRPSEGSGSAGAMAATKKHLEDMRTLVFHPMGLK